MKISKHEKWKSQISYEKTCESESARPPFFGGLHFLTRPHVPGPMPSALPNFGPPTPLPLKWGVDSDVTNWRKWGSPKSCLGMPKSFKAGYLENQSSFALEIFRNGSSHYFLPFPKFSAKHYDFFPRYCPKTLFWACFGPKFGPRHFPQKSGSLTLILRFS